MMLELCFAPGACSFVPHVGLEVVKLATGTDYTSTMIKLHKGEHLQADFLALNPDAQVPVLLVNSKPLTQIVAMADWLDRQYPTAGLLPADPWERAGALSRLAWFNNTVHPTFTHVFRASSFVDDDAAQAQVRAHAAKRYAGQLRQIQDMTPADGFWLGKTPGFLDAYAFVLLRWGGFAGVDPASLPKYQSYAERVMQAPAVATVIARERIGLDTFK